MDCLFSFIFATFIIAHIYLYISDATSTHSFTCIFMCWCGYMAFSLYFFLQRLKPNTHENSILFLLLKVLELNFCSSPSPQIFQTHIFSALCLCSFTIWFEQKLATLVSSNSKIYFLFSPILLRNPHH